MKIAIASYSLIVALSGCANKNSPGEYGVNVADHGGTMRDCAALESFHDNSQSSNACLDELRRIHRDIPLTVIETSAPPTENMAVLLDRYRTVTECEGSDYTKIMALENKAADLPQIDDPSMFELLISLRRNAAKSLIELAEEAEAKSCHQTARNTYLAVIDMFSGSAYAAVRQRAQIGIDDLRAAQSQARKVQSN